MRIGLDAKWYFEGPPSGRVWTREMIGRLAAGWPEHSWTLFLRNADRGAASQVERWGRPVFASLGWNLLSNAVAMPLSRSARAQDVLLTQSFAAPLPRTRQVTVIHDVIHDSHPEWFTLRERIYHSFKKKLLPWATTVVTVSEYSRDQLYRFGYIGPGQQCAVVPNGVDDRFCVVPVANEAASIRARHRLPPTYVLYVGRLNTRKNLSRLLEAYSKLGDTRIGLVVAGTPEGVSEDYPKLARSLGIAERVRFLGHVPDEDLPALYRSASLFAYVSLEEGFGLPPLEAMASGVPVVVSDDPALREVCGEAAEYVDPRSTPAITAALSRLSNDTVLRESRIQLGRQRARQYTWDRAAEKLMRVLTCPRLNAPRPDG